jgi:hypothetical protein
MAEVKSAIDAYAENVLATGISGIRITVSKGSVNEWHAYVTVLAKKEQQSFIETGRHADFFGALMELEELLARLLEKEVAK